jgi:hypothetical protein
VTTHPQAPLPNPPARRRTRHPNITLSEAVNLSQAWQFAINQGWPPNQFASVNWAKAPSTAVPDPVQRIGLVRDRMKAFLRRHAPGLPFVWIEVREKPSLQGEGVHWVIHVPHALTKQFKASLRNWVANEADSLDPAAVNVKSVDTWFGLRNYLLKGGSEEVRRLYDANKYRKPFQGVIYGPRVRVSHAIGPKARTEAPETPASALEEQSLAA